MNKWGISISDEAWKSLFYFLAKQVKVFIAVIQCIAKYFSLLMLMATFIEYQKYKLEFLYAAF